MSRIRNTGLYLYSKQCSLHDFQFVTFSFRSEGYEVFSPVVNTVLTAPSPGESILVFASPSFCSLKHWLVRVVIELFLISYLDERCGHTNLEFFFIRLERKVT
jgi:hypothetical protein